MRVVIDSGIWISAFEYKGTPLQALETIFTKDRIATCDSIEAEIISVLQRKFRRTSEATRRLLDTYLVAALRVQVTGEVQGVCRDPKDDMVLECAARSRAHLIISGDRDLLSMGSFQSTRILTAREYLRHRADA